MLLLIVKHVLTTVSLHVFYTLFGELSCSSHMLLHHHPYSENTWEIRSGSPNKQIKLWDELIDSHKLGVGIYKNILVKWIRVFWHKRLSYSTRKKERKERGRVLNKGQMPMQEGKNYILLFLIFPNILTSNTGLVRIQLFF